MKLSDFRNLDRNNVGAWPDGVKYTACILLFALLLFVGWYWSISGQSDTLVQKQKQEIELKKDFHDKQLKVVNLEKLKTQLDDMREILRQLLRQLPGKTEMPELLDDVSRSALSAGLDVQLFEPGAEAIRKVSTPRNRSSCACSATTINSVPSSARWRRCRAWSS